MVSALNGKALDFGEHAGHQVHLHRHGPPPDGGVEFCSKRWLCQSCTSKPLPKGTWFDGPLCPGTVSREGKRR